MGRIAVLGSPVALPLCWMLAPLALQSRWQVLDLLLLWLLEVKMVSCLQSLLSESIQWFCNSAGPGYLNLVTVGEVHLQLFFSSLILLPFIHSEPVKRDIPAHTLASQISSSLRREVFPDGIYCLPQLSVFAVACFPKASDGLSRVESSLLAPRESITY